MVTGGHEEDDMSGAAGRVVCGQKIGDLDKQLDDKR